MNEVIIDGVRYFPEDHTTGKDELSRLYRINGVDAHSIGGDSVGLSLFHGAEVRVNLINSDFCCPHITIDNQEFTIEELENLIEVLKVLVDIRKEARNG